MRLLVRGAIAFPLFCATMACAGGGPTAPGKAPLDGTAWVLAGLEGQGAAGRSAATLQFEDGRLSGSDGCNRFSGSYSATTSAFAVSPQLASTQMACAPEVEARARAFLAALTTAKAYRLDGSMLVLVAADGALAAAFVRAKDQ